MLFELPKNSAKIQLSKVFLR